MAMMKTYSDKELEILSKPSRNDESKLLIQPERSKREDMEGPSHTPDKGWPDKNAGFP